MRSQLVTQDLYNIYFKMCFDFKVQNYQQTSSITYQLVFTHEQFLWLSKSSSCYFNLTLMFDFYSLIIQTRSSTFEPKYVICFQQFILIHLHQLIFFPLQVKRPTKYYFQYFYFFATPTNNCITLLIIDINEIVKKFHKKQFEGNMIMNAIITLWKSSFINVKPSPSLWIAPSINIIFINKINMMGWWCCVLRWWFYGFPTFFVWPP
jgi:hypothetical protein